MDSLKGVSRDLGDFIPDSLEGVIQFPGSPGIGSSSSISPRNINIINIETTIFCQEASTISLVIFFHLVFSQSST